MGISIKETTTIIGNLVIYSTKLAAAAQSGDTYLLNGIPTSLMRPDGLRELSSELLKTANRLTDALPDGEISIGKEEEEGGLR